MSTIERLKAETVADGKMLGVAIPVASKDCVDIFKVTEMPKDEKSMKDLTKSYVELTDSINQYGQDNYNRGLKAGSDIASIGIGAGILLAGLIDFIVRSIKKK